MCATHGWTYTRYADDLTFSAGPGRRGEVPMLLARVRHIVEEEGFAINPRKGRVQRAGRQAVTGIVVNKKPGAAARGGAPAAGDPPRRAADRAGGAEPRAASRTSRPGCAGKIAYLAMIDRPRGLAKLRQLDALTARG